MRVVCDIEGNGLKPTHIWVICCLDIDNNTTYVFRNLTLDVSEKERFIEFAKGIQHWIGHNFLEYDYPAMRDLLGLRIDLGKCTDTLIVSRLVDYSRNGGHSIEQYGIEFNCPKGQFNDWSKYSVEMENYCVRDTRICASVYSHYLHILMDSSWQQALRTEHEFQMVVNALHDNGFGFNTDRARDLLRQVEEELGQLDAKIKTAFLPRTKLIKEVHPKETKHGTLSKIGFKFVRSGDLCDFNGGPFSLFEWVEFNPASPKQVVLELNKAGWKPVVKTKTHIEVEREINRLKWQIKDPRQLDLKTKELHNRLQSSRKFGWKVSEENLDTLPNDAPEPARLLARRILVESRRRTLTEWLSLVGTNDRIHGKFYGIGCWTHRMSHQKPNTANIPTPVKYLGKEMRSLWIAPKGRLLIGTDAEGIQLRVFAHLINDEEFTNALVKGRKENKTDPHSLNQSILGAVCSSRNIAKKFIFALVLGAGIGKLAEILGCSIPLAQEALSRLLQRYSGLAYLREKVIPKDAERGWFQGLDGRRVQIPSDTFGGRKHLTMSGYLQTGEAVVMKMASIRWCRKLCPEVFD